MTLGVSYGPNQGFELAVPVIALYNINNTLKKNLKFEKKNLFLNRTHPYNSEYGKIIPVCIKIAIFLKNSKTSFQIFFFLSLCGFFLYVKNQKMTKLAIMVVI